MKHLLQNLKKILKKLPVINLQSHTSMLSVAKVLMNIDSWQYGTVVCKVYKSFSLAPISLRVHTSQGETLRKTKFPWFFKICYDSIHCNCVAVMKRDKYNIPEIPVHSYFYRIL